MSSQPRLPQPAAPPVSLAPVSIAVPPSAQKVAKPRTFASLREDRHREFIWKINGQRLTAIRDVSIQMNGNHGPMAEVTIQVMSDPAGIQTADGRMDISTYGFSSLGLPPVLKQLQALADEVHDLANDIGVLSSKGCEIKAVCDDWGEATSTEEFLWSFITGRIDEKELTQRMGSGLENLHMVELSQLLNPLVEQYKTILNNGLKREKV